MRATQVIHTGFARTVLGWQMSKVVLKLGGFAFDAELSGAKIRRYLEVIRTFSRKNQIVVVTGGGPISRRYIAAARELGASEAICDQVGIHISRANARLLVAGLGGSAFPEIPEHLEDLLRYVTSGLAVVTGGFQPAQSTNGVAALAAEATGADLFVNATDVDGVYTADPHKDPKAKRMDEVSIEELMRILSTEGFQAGEYALMDPLSLRVMQRSGIPVTIMDGRDPSNIEKALRGRRIGTKVVPAKGSSR